MNYFNIALIYSYTAEYTGAYNELQNSARSRDLWRVKPIGVHAQESPAQLWEGFSVNLEPFFFQ